MRPNDARFGAARSGAQDPLVSHVTHSLGNDEEWKKAVHEVVRGRTHAAGMRTPLARLLDTQCEASHAR